jgi:hypothetical protein
MGLKDFLRPRFPLVGVGISDLVAALTLLASANEVGKKQILKVEARQDGHLLIQTGKLLGQRAGCGQEVLLRQSPNGWQIVEVGHWRA